MKARIEQVMAHPSHRFGSCPAVVTFAAARPVPDGTVHVARYERAQIEGGEEVG